MLMGIRWASWCLMVVAHHKGSWSEVVGGRGWAPMVGKMALRIVVLKQSRGCFGPSLDFLRWFWQLPMVLELLGELERASGGSGLMKTRPETTVEADRKSCSSRGRQCRLILRGVLAEVLRPLLTQFIQSMS